MRFAIVANQSDHQSLVTQALENSESPNRGDRLSTRIRRANDPEGDVIGIWAEVDREVVEGKGKVGPLRVNIADAIVRNPGDGRVLNLPRELRGENAESKNRGLVGPAKDVSD